MEVRQGAKRFRLCDLEVLSNQFDALSCPLDEKPCKYMALALPLDPANSGTNAGKANVKAFRRRPETDGVSRYSRIRAKPDAATKPTKKPGKVAGLGGTAGGKESWRDPRTRILEERKPPFAFLELGHQTS